MPHRISILLFALLLAACDTVVDDPPAPTSDGLFVVNQGNFGDGNGSVTFVELGQTPSAAETIGGFGSILQSAALLDGRMYLLANTGERIDIYNAESLEQTGQIEDVISPRYMIASGRTAYVTNLYSASGAFSGGNVTMIDLVDRSIVDVIPVGDNPEGLTIAGDRLYVANHSFGSGSTLSVIDIPSRAVVDTVDVDCDGPRFLFTDDEDEVFVFCTGQTLYDETFNEVGETDGAVRVLDGDTGEILHRIAVDGRITTEGGQDAFHAEGDNRIYAVKDRTSLLVFNTATNSLSTTIGPFEGDPISAVAFDEQRRQIYLGRSAGFVASGSVTFHSEDGAQVAEVDAGIAPSYLVIQAN